MWKNTGVFELMQFMSLLLMCLSVQMSFPCRPAYFHLCSVTLLLLLVLYQFLCQSMDEVHGSTCRSGTFLHPRFHQFWSAFSQNHDTVDFVEPLSWPPLLMRVWTKTFITLKDLLTLLFIQVLVFMSDFSLFSLLKKGVLRAPVHWDHLDFSMNRTTRCNLRSCVRSLL